MHDQFLRHYKLVIGTEGQADALLFTDLRITFTLEQNLYGYPNLLTLQVYNLSSQSMATLQRSQPGTPHTFQRVLLQVGYGDQPLKTLFVGSISNIWVRRAGVDRITEIFAKDGLANLDGAYFSGTYAAGTGLGSILEGVTKGLGVLGKKVLDRLNSITTPAPAAYSGSVKDVLNQLGQQHSFQWSIQNGVLQYTELDAKPPVFPDQAILITKRSGLIGSPTLTYVGVEAKALLNPEIKPGAIVKIEAQAPNINVGNLQFQPVLRELGDGYFFVQQAVHTGDTRGNDWYTDITGRALEA